MVTITNTSNNQSLQLSDHIEHEALKENLEEQTRDAINILQMKMTSIQSELYLS